MTAPSAAAPTKPQRSRPNRSGLWNGLRLLGGWACVAALAYLMMTPNKDWGWPTLVFGWVLLTLLADEFGGWFGYIALALGVLPLLAATPIEQWFTIFPLVLAALFALMLVKHSGGPFVVPFAALIFAVAILGGEKLGVKMKVPLPLLGSNTFHRMTLMPMAAVMAFSFVRQLVSMVVRWQANRTKRVVTTTTTQTTLPTPVPAEDPEPVSDVTVVTPAPKAPAVPATPVAANTPAAAAETTIITTPVPPVTTDPVVVQPVAASSNPTLIDLDLGEAAEPDATPPAPRQS